MDYCSDCANWCKVSNYLPTRIFDACLLDGPGDSPDDVACEDFEREEQT
jgi:hypothetical protein